MKNVNQVKEKPVNKYRHRGGYGIRTHMAEPLVPKTSVSTNFTNPPIGILNYDTKYSVNKKW